MKRIIKYFAKYVAEQIYVFELQNKLRRVVINIDNRLHDKILSLTFGETKDKEFVQITDNRGVVMFKVIGSGVDGELTSYDYEDLIYTVRNFSWY